MKTYKISKTNHGHENRSNENHLSGLTSEEARFELAVIERLFKKYDGVILEKTDDLLTVACDDGKNKITYAIVEENK